MNKISHGLKLASINQRKHQSYLSLQIKHLNIKYITVTVIINWVSQQVITEFSCLFSFHSKCEPDTVAVQTAQSHHGCFWHCMFIISLSFHPRVLFIPTLLSVHHLHLPSTLTVRAAETLLWSIRGPAVQKCIYTYRKHFLLYAKV